MKKALKITSISAGNLGANFFCGIKQNKHGNYNSVDFDGQHDFNRFKILKYYFYRLEYPLYTRKSNLLVRKSISNVKGQFWSNRNTASYSEQKVTKTLCALFFITAFSKSWLSGSANFPSINSIFLKMSRHNGICRFFFEILICANLIGEIFYWKFILSVESMPLH